MLGKTFYIGILGLVFGALFWACEKDDTCADQTLTPYLIIRFMESDDADNPDDVVDLQITYIGEDEVTDPNQDVFSSPQTTDSITLSLPTFKDRAVFAFKQNFNAIDDTNTEIDTIEFTYSRTNEYISRACGFKTLYSNFQANIIRGPGNNGFITSEIVEQNTIEDEEEAHLRLLH